MEDGFKSRSILIAGLGLIGGSIAKALRAAGYTGLSAYDADLTALEFASAEGVICSGYSDIIELPEADVIICCLPPAASAEFCREAQGRLTDGGVFAEMGGLKKGITEKLAQALTGNHELLSLHPMAGKEKSGYINSDAELFRDCIMILTPTVKTGISALMWARELQLVFGCRDILELSAERHDEVIARVSHLPHALALAIKAMNKEERLSRFAGGSYRSATRVADLNPKLWAELFNYNRDNLLKSISLLKESLVVLEDALKKGDAAELEKLLESISRDGE
jgi:prephenate dehydrogenase